MLEPESPTCPVKIQPLPNLQLCPICTRLSILTPSEIMVDLKTALSTVQFAPISTSFPISTLLITVISSLAYPSVISSLAP